MIHRKERPKIRQSIIKFLDEHEYTIQDLHAHVVENKFTYSSGLRTQIHKMFLEVEAEIFKNNLTYIKVENRQLPIVYCTSEGTRWSFYCPFCQKRHFHSPSEGRRHAHCGYEGKSIFCPHGYYLKLVENNG